jgi:hypothetical protein
MAITNPDANTIRLTNESAADFDDIVSAGVSGITKTGTATYVITRALSLVNSTLSDTNKIIRFEWGAITTPLLIDDDSELQLGELDGDGYGINGCQVFMNSSYSGSSTINLGGPPSGDNTGNIKFYGCYIKGISPNTTGIGVNGTYFWRLYDNSTAQVNDIRDCQIEFNGGGRFHGTNSKLVRNKFINCKTAVSPFTTRSPFGEISNNQVFACSAAYYWYPLQSGSLTVTNAFGRDNDYAAIVSSVSSDTNQTLTFVDADFDTFTFSWLGAGGTNLRVREDYNYVPTVLDQATQTAITSGRIYIQNLAGTQVYNEALDGNGQVGELILRAGQYRRATGNTRTDETPHTVKVRCYGYQFQEFPVDIGARTVTNLSQIENSFVVANEATAGAYTGITVNGLTETITITSDHTLQEIYDYCNWWASQSVNMQYDMPMITSDGVNFLMISGWDFVVSSTYTVTAEGQTLTLSGGGSFTISGDFTGLITDGTNSRVPITLTGIVDGSKYRIEETSGGTLIAQGTQSGTGDIIIYDTITANLGITVKVRLYGYLPFESSATATKASGASVVVNQIQDTIVV